MTEHVLTLDWCCYPVGEWEIPHPHHSRSGATAIPMCSCGWRGNPHPRNAYLGELTQGTRARREWEQHVSPCRVVYVECCYGLRVRPAHGCKWIPVCPCGWIGTEYHASQLEASQEGTAHVNGEEYLPPWARTSTRASFVLSGRETPPGYARTEQVQALVDKLRALRDARAKAS